MTNKLLTFYRISVFTLLFACISVGFAMAQNLVVFTPGNATASSVASGITASNWSKNSIANASAWSTCTTTSDYSANNVTNASSAAAITDGKFFSFSLTPSCQMSLTAVTASSMAADAANIKALWSYRIGSTGAWTDCSTIQTISNSCASPSTYTFTFPSTITTTSTVYFRLIVYNAASGKRVTLSNTIYVAGTTAAPSVSIAASANPVCTNTAVTFTATPTNAGTAAYQWYKGGSAISGATAATFTEYNLTNSGTYSCTLTSTGFCASATTATSNTVNETVNTQPAGNFSYSSYGFCSSVNSNQSISTSSLVGASGTYTAPAGLTINAASGAINPATSTAGTYAVTYSVPATGGCAAYSTSTNVTIDQAGAGTISYPASTLCGASSQTVAPTITNAAGTGSSTWFTSTPSGLAINGSGVITPSSSAAGNYTITYNRSSTGLCPAYATTATVTINTTVPSITSTNGASRCGNGTVTLTANASSGTINWYTVASGGTAIANGTSYTTPTLSATTTYYVDASNNACTSASRTAVVATINPNVTPTVVVSAAANPFCAGTTVAFTATITNGGTSPTIQWYDGFTAINGATSATLNYAPANGDNIACLLITNATCVTTTWAFDSETMNANTSTVAAGVTLNTTPANGVVNTAIPAFTATVTNVCGVTATGNTSTLTVTKVSGPGAIGGTTTVAAVNGIATFNGITFSAKGSYTISVTDGTNTSAVSSTIIISDATTVTNLSPATGYVGTTVTLSGTGFQNNAGTPIVTQISLNGTTISAANYTVNSASSITVTIPSGATSGVFTVTTSNGSASSSTFTMAGYLSVQTGNWSAGSTWLGGAVPFTTASVTIAAGHIVTYNSSMSSTLTLANLTINGTLKNTQASTFSISGSTVVNNGGTYEHSFDGGRIITATWNTGSTCLVDGIINNMPNTATFNQSFYDFTWNCPAMNTLNSLAGNLRTITNDFTIMSTGSIARLSLVGSSTASSLSIGGDLIIAGGTLNLSANTGVATINLMGNFIQSGGAINSTGGSVDHIAFLNTTTPQTITQTGGTISSTNATIWEIGSATVSAYVSLLSNFNIGIGNLYAYNNSTIDFKTYALSSTGYFQAFNTVNLITANASVFGGTFSGGLTATHIDIPTTADITLNGTAAQVINSINATNTCASLTINNPSSVTNNIIINTGLLNIIGGTFNSTAKIVTTGMVVNGGNVNSSDSIRTSTLTLSNGIVNMTAKELYVTSSATSAISGYAGLHAATANSYIIGNLRRKVTTGTYDFPVGASTAYELAQVKINNNSNVSSLLVSYKTWDGANLSYSANTPAFNATPAGAPQATLVNKLLNHGYFEITPFDNNLTLVTAPTINYEVTMTFNGHTNAIVGSSAAMNYTIAKAPHTNNSVVTWGLGGGSFNTASQQSSGISASATVTAKLSGLNSFSVFAAGFNNNNTVLPLHWNTFTVTADDENAFLNWSTYAEQNTSHFVVERSVDKINFTAIGMVTAANKLSLNNYEFTDLDFQNLSNQTVYYRIQLVNQDETVEYSEINAVVNANLAAIDELKLYPNPTNGALTIQLACKANEPLTITVMDLNGKIMNMLTSNVVSGINKIDATALIASLPVGMYLISAETQSGSHFNRMQLIKE